MAGFHFFTNADLLAAQLPGQAFGPAGTAGGADLYGTTSLHTATSDPVAYAVCSGIVCVQEIPNSVLVNLVLRPLEQPPLNFVPVKYIIYKGIRKDSLVSGNEVQQAPTNRLTQSVWDTQAKKNASANAQSNPPAEALGLGLTAAASADFADTEPIDNFFYRTGVSFQLHRVEGGWSIGQFDKSGFGIEILLEGLGFHHPISLARKVENVISVPALAASATPAQRFEHRHAKEQVLGFMDPCAFYGCFFGTGVRARSSTGSAFEPKQGSDVYSGLLATFSNRKTAYVDIRNEHNYSLNYFGNYTDTILLSCDPVSTALAPVDYYGSGWPLLKLDPASFPTNNTARARNTFRIQLPVGDNAKPLLFVSQGCRDLGMKGGGFPPELKDADRFFDAFQAPSGGYTTTQLTSRRSLTFAVPNVTGQGVTTPVACYIRLKYLKQQHGPAVGFPGGPLVGSENYLDNLLYPLDLRIPFKGPSPLKSFVYDEEVYVNAQDVPGLRFDFIGKMGIARDSANTTFFLIPTVLRKHVGAAAQVISLSGEMSDADRAYLDLVASRYPRVRVRRTDLVFSATPPEPLIELVSDAGTPGGEAFGTPDLNLLVAIVLANTTVDAWAAQPAPVDERFRVYLGVKNLQKQTDDQGVPYISFQLVLRGLVPDVAGTDYEVREVHTDPDNLHDVTLYAPATVREFAITGSTLLDIDNSQLEYLSAAPHTYFAGNTRVHGTVSVEGDEQDGLQSLVLEVLQDGVVVATGALAPGPAATLLLPFGPAGRLAVEQPQLLFNLPSAQLGGIDSAADGTLTLRLRAQSTNGLEATRDAGEVSILARYTGANRYGTRDQAQGGDDWARPSVLDLLGQPAGVFYGDMSNMNGGPFAPHASHRDGLDVDGWYAGYPARDAATAQVMIAHLNAPYGSSISRVFVTYTTSPPDAFLLAIQGVVLDDGRLATDVIRPVADHTTHFHWRFAS